MIRVLVMRTMETSTRQTIVNGVCNDDIFTPNESPTYARFLCVSPESTLHICAHTDTHTAMYWVEFGELDTCQGKWGHEFDPTFLVCIQILSSDRRNQIIC